MRLISLFVAVCLIALWAAVLVLGLPLAMAIIPTVLVALGCIGLFLYRRHQASQAARNIEHALGAQADAQLQNVRPDQQEELQAMQAEFTKAIQALKSSKLARARQGKDALSVLPWYMIIGPPGSGKSTALRNSGIQFPYLSSRGGVKGVGGTRNCEWWLTNEAVILDTAGRYTTEDDDREEWLSFLDMLKGNRSRKPVNGLIVAVSIGELIGIDEEQSTQLAQRIRERVDEVMERLKMIVPVYLMFTKCDLLSGFVDVFGDLAKSERGQIWGFTVRMGEAGNAPGELFQSHFGELVEVVEQRCIARMGEERHPEVRERVFCFPQQLEGLRSNLTEFVQALFAENVYADTPVMRGVYFTSGTQEGSPIDRVMNVMADAFGIRRSLQQPGSRPAVEARSYFLRDLFAEVIFPDQDLAVRSTSEVERQKRLHYAYAGGCLALALLILLFPVISFFKNRGLIQNARMAAQVLKLAEASGAGPAKMAEALQAMRQQLDMLLTWEREGAPVGMRFGMYRGHDLIGPLGSFYGSATRRTLIEPVLGADVEEMAAFVEARRDSPEAPSGSDYAHYFEQLKLHLLLSGPRTQREPVVGEEERAWLVTHLAERWSSEPGFNDSSHRIDMLSSHIDLFVKLLAQDASLAAPRNDKVVREVRVTLDRMPFTSLVLEQLIAEGGRKRQDVTIASVLGSSTRHLRSEGRVRYIFTREGWESLARARLEHPLRGSDWWVLGKDPDATNDVAMERQEAALRSRYYEQYIQEWKTFLDSITVEQPGENTEVLAMLEELTHGEPVPTARLFWALAHNVRLCARDEADAVEKPGVIERLKDRLGPRRNASGTQEGLLPRKLGNGGASREGEDIFAECDVEVPFAGLLKFAVPPQRSPGPNTPPETTSLDSYQEQLQFLRDALRNSLENPEDPGAQVRVQTGRERVRSLIQSQEVGWRPRIEAMLWPPIEAVSNAFTKTRCGKLSLQWNSEVTKAFNDSLAGRYPFSRTGHDAAVADMGAFFRPDSGTVWGFYNGILKADIQQSGKIFIVANRFGSMYSPALLAFLTRSREISDSLFAPGAQEPGVQFSFHIRPSPKVASIRFTVDGQTVNYNNGLEEWHSFKWPGQGGKVGASIEVRNSRGQVESIEREGEWGLFRLMEEGTAQVEPGSRVFSVTWKMPSTDTDVVIDFRASRSATPFFGVSAGRNSKLMQPFRMPGVVPPRVIGKGAAGCSR